ncbi:RNA polymerase sigma-70 factor (sigma-E family) [Allocatelliglobosispora scoriae]|uniref:RNA polymerase sigma-70 factor (Sigma-E family) n=1 Tax=Allocatelliglobosispora scoriae TaxID=643052 RepID=A0A841BYM0_9ACTN|nr:SigE family RNA polymerase sigma factor [Allocatelliglobosispora scoriae]MBB5872765.1 RNA polymerase sigma-70 factor (sigma-E family) [Allocatelliglobosispora scoriae]
MKVDAEKDYGDYVTARAPGLVRFAYLTCGDWHRSEDAVQTALAKLYVAWPRLHNRESIDAYVRRIVVRALIDERRLGWFRRERTTSELPERPVTDSPASTDERFALLAALSQVPPRQRAVLVLRFWEDQSVEQVADLLGCSTGTVKSQCARGLHTLRGLLTDPLSAQALGAA